MKNITLFALSGMASLIILYLCTSFINWNINPSNWGGDARTLFVVLWVCSVCAFAPICFDRKEP